MTNLTKQEFFKFAIQENQQNENGLILFGSSKKLKYKKNKEYLMSLIDIGKSQHSVLNFFTNELYIIFLGIKIA